MKFIVCLLLTAFLAFVAGLYMPWWTIAVAAFVVSVMIYQTPGKAFLSGGLGIFVLWGVLSWTIDSSNNGLLSAKIALILPFGGSVVLLMLATAFIGFLVGGFASLSGSYFRRLNL